jgi:Cu/Ag efflux protein CusF
MKRIITALGICALLAGAAQTFAQEDTSKSKGAVKSATKEIKATVQSIDKETREVTLKKEDGTMVTIKAPESAQNFDQLKVGDVLTAKYTAAVAFSIRRSDEPPSATGRESVTRGDGTTTARKTMQISATIEKINPDTRELTLKGPEGKTREVTVPEDYKKFDQLKEGDKVVVTATEALAVSLSSSQEQK